MVCLTVVTMAEMWDHQRAVMSVFPLVYKSVVSSVLSLVASMVVN